MNRTALAYALTLSLLAVSICHAARPRGSTARPRFRGQVAAGSPVQKLTPRTTITTKTPVTTRATITLPVALTLNLEAEIETELRQDLQLNTGLYLDSRARRRPPFFEREGGLAQCFVQLILGRRIDPPPASEIRLLLQ